MVPRDDGGAARPRLIVGLGNSGREYADTRHNLGFRVVDLVAARVGLRFRRSKWRAAAAIGQAFGHSVVLLKPSTDMNASGRAVRAAAAALGLAPPDILVVHDELDLPAGAIRVRERGSAGGHNGVRSIIASLRADDFPRIRIGVGRPTGGDPLEYLLESVLPEERAAEDAAVARAADTVELALRDGLAF